MNAPPARATCSRDVVIKRGEQTYRRTDHLYKQMFVLFCINVWQTFGIRRRRVARKFLFGRPINLGLFIIINNILSAENLCFITTPLGAITHIRNRNDLKFIISCLKKPFKVYRFGILKNGIFHIPNR